MCCSPAPWHHLRHQSWRSASSCGGAGMELLPRFALQICSQRGVDPVLLIGPEPPTLWTDNQSKAGAGKRSHLPRANVLALHCQQCIMRLWCDADGKEIEGVSELVETVGRQPVTLEDFWA